MNEIAPVLEQMYRFFPLGGVSKLRVDNSYKYEVPTDNLFANGVTCKNPDIAKVILRRATAAYKRNFDSMSTLVDFLHSRIPNEIKRGLAEKVHPGKSFEDWFMDDLTIDFTCHPNKQEAEYTFNRKDLETNPMFIYAHCFFVHKDLHEALSPIVGIGSTNYGDQSMDVNFSLTDRIPDDLVVLRN